MGQFFSTQRSTGNVPHMVQPLAHILGMKEVLTVKVREFVPAGGPAPELNEQEYAAFLLQVQRAIVFSLEKRELLTPLQRECCLAELEKQFSQSRQRVRRT